MEVGEQGLLIGEATGDLGVQVVAGLCTADAYSSFGEYRRGIDLLSRNVRAPQGERVRERFGMTGFPAAQSRGLLAVFLATVGDFSEAVQWAEDGISIAESIGQPYTQVVVWWDAGDVYNRRGEFDRAARYLERGLALCRAASSLARFICGHRSRRARDGSTGLRPLAHAVRRRGVARDVLT